METGEIAGKRYYGTVGAMFVPSHDKILKSPDILLTNSAPFSIMALMRTCPCNEINGLRCQEDVSPKPDLSVVLDTQDTSHKRQEC